MAFFQGRNRVLKAARGFTLVELLVIISILGVLAAVVVLNVIGFMNEGSAEAKAVELKQVHTAAGIYLLEDTLASATTVGPGNKGIVAPWLTGDLQYYWTIDTDGSVHPLLFASSLNNLDGFTSVTGSWTPGAGGLSASGDAGSLVATGGNWDDFTFQTTATLTSGDGYGMYYRSDSDANTGYIFQFDPILGFTVSDVANGTILAQAAIPPGFPVNGQHNISVSVSGSSHTIKVDGSTVMTFTDSTYGSGTVGLQSEAGSSVNFTSFTVSPP